VRVLFVAPSYYPSIGGVEYVVKSIAERLARMGHEVTVVAGNPGAGEPREEEVSGVRVVRWPVWGPGGAYHFPGRSLEGFLVDLARYANIVHIHSVHSVFSVLAGLALTKASRKARVVVTPHYHGTGHTYARRVLWLPWRRWVSKLLRGADVVHAVSGREASLVLSHYPHVRGRVAIVPNGVDEDVYGYRWLGRSSGYMLYAGRVEKYKRLDLAVRVAKEMGLKLLVIGRGSYRDKLAKYAERVYRGGVELLDPQPRERYLELLSQARYAVNPSKQEAFSIFVAEALAMGMPALTSREIAENLEAIVKFFNNELVVIERAPVKTWSEVVHQYLSKLY